MSDSLDPDHDRHIVGPDLDPNCLQRSSADDKLSFSKNSFRNTIRVSNSFDPDQDGCSVGPDLDPNCLQRLSAEDKLIFFKKFFQKHYQSVKQLGSRSG